MKTAFYVASFAENDDALDVLRGGGVTLDPRTVGGGRTTYAAITLGVNIKPPVPKVNIKPPVPKPLTGFVVRPELRYDRALTNTRPFNDSSDRDQFTASVDFILTF